MSIDLQAGREMVWQCVSQCSESDIGSFYIPDAILLEDTGSYVSDSCMRHCVDAAVQVFTTAAETTTIVTTGAMEAGKQVIEISIKEVAAEQLTFGLIATIVIVIAIGGYYLYSIRSTSKTKLTEKTL